MGEIVELISPEKIQKYAVYSVRNSTDEGLLYTRSFIVIKNGYGVITRFTRLQEFTGVYENHTYKPLTSNPEGKLYFVVAMLNYVLVDHGAENGMEAWQIEAVAQAVAMSYRKAGMIVKSTLDEAGGEGCLGMTLRKIASGSAASKQEECMCLTQLFIM